MTRLERGTLIAAVLGSAIVFLDSTVVTVALTRIGRDLPTSLFGVLEGLSYIYNGYLLTLSSLLVLAGALNDFLGRRRMFALGLVGFGLTSVLCGLAPTMELLVLFRVLQGAAGALLVPSSLALITTTFSGEQQGRAFGVWAAASAATTILGPFVGGLLVDIVSWRAVFLINVPLVLAALWATATYVVESRDPNATGRFDWIGAIVVAVAVGGLSFGATYGQQREWREPLPFVALAAGALATVALPFLMGRRRDPLIPLWLFRSRNFTVTNISTLLIYGALYVYGYYLVLMQQGVLGYAAAAAGLAVIPPALMLVLLSTRFGALAGRYGPRVFMSIGPALMGAGILWFARLPPTSRPWTFMAGDPASWVPPVDYLIDFLPGQLVFGFGLGMMVAPLTTALMTSVPPGNSGVASAINNAVSRVGPQLAGAVIFVAITASFYGGMAARLSGTDTSDPAFRRAYVPLVVPSASDPRAEAARAQSTESFHLAMLVSAALLFAGAAVNFAGISDEAALAAARRRTPVTTV